MVHVVGDAAAMIALPALRRRPTVVGTHGLHLLRRASGLPGVLVRARMRAVLRAARAVVCGSGAEIDELEALLPGAPLRLVVNGTPLPPEEDPGDRRVARAGLGLADDAVVALYLGQLEARKRPLEAVEAAEGAPRRGALRAALGG